MADNLVQPNPAAPAAAPVVQPNAQAAPAAPAEAPEDAGAGLSPELIQIPAIQGLLSGEPAAVSVSIAEFDASPEGKAITANKEPLMNAGMGFYRSLGGDLGAIFNRMYLSDTEIQEADKAGKLTEVAPPLAQVNQMLSQAGAQNPVLQDKQRPTGLKMSGAPAPASLPVTNVKQPAPAPTGKTPSRLLGAKVRNLDPGSPTEGPKPGAGRILNQILKPVI